MGSVPNENVINNLPENPVSCKNLICTNFSLEIVRYLYWHLEIGQWNPVYLGEILSRERYVSLKLWTIGFQQESGKRKRLLVFRSLCVLVSRTIGLDGSDGDGALTCKTMVVTFLPLYTHQDNLPPISSYTDTLSHRQSAFQASVPTWLLDPVNIPKGANITVIPFSPESSQKAGIQTAVLA